MLNFWASWCEPCQDEAPLLERAQTQLATPRRHRARRDLSGRLARLRTLRPPVPPHLPQPARHDRRLRPLLRHRPAPRELRRSTARATSSRSPAARSTRPSSTARSRSRSARETAHGRLAGPARRRRALLLGALPARVRRARRRRRRPPTPRTSLPVIERQVMCVTCKIPLERRRVAAGRPRARIHPGPDRRRPGRSADQARARRPVRPDGARAAERARLRPDRLPRARSRSFLALLATLALLLPRWRRHARAPGRQRARRRRRSSAADAARLDADLARFD